MNPIHLSAGPESQRPARLRRARKRVLLVLAYYDYRHHSGVARYAAEAGWVLEDAYTQLRGLPDTWDGDGIISFHSASAQFIDWLKKFPGPVVDLGEHDDYSDFHRVKTDNERIGRMAVDHFAAKGYKNVGFVWQTDNTLKKRRMDAMRVAAEAQGMQFWDVPLESIPGLAEKGAFPIALLALNDSVAVRALSACEDAGIMVPEQAALLGIDNFEYRCVPASVPLSSIDANQERVGYEAAAMLDKLMAPQAVEERIVKIAPAGIVERESTNMLAVGDLEVAKALRFIIQNFRKRTGLKDVSRATSISLRRLQTRFKEALGRTILQEINGRRVAHARHLLESTNKKIRVVAAECGFGSSVKLIRVFKQYVGTSPKRYRKQVRRSERAAATPRPGGDEPERQAVGTAEG